MTPYEEYLAAQAKWNAQREAFKVIIARLNERIADLQKENLTLQKEKQS